MTTATISNDRDDSIHAIKAALKTRSGRAWSVRGGKGTAWGWISIKAQAKHLNEYGYMSAADCATLAGLLGLDHVHDQGVSIPASSAYRAEYIARAQGRTPEVTGTPYWD